MRYLSIKDMTPTFSIRTVAGAQTQYILEAYTAEEVQPSIIFGIAEQVYTKWARGSNW
jgi:hypothetical protein